MQGASTFPPKINFVVYNADISTTAAASSSSSKSSSVSSSKKASVSENSNVVDLNLLSKVLETLDSLGQVSQLLMLADRCGSFHQLNSENWTTHCI